MSAHTPGPWIAEERHIWAGKTLVANVYKQVSTGDARGYAVANANAHLIAAAPRMLEWLKDYVSRASDSNPLKRSALDILKEIESCGGEKSDGH